MQRCASNHPVNLYKKGLILLCVAHTLQGALEMGKEARNVQINFSTAFDTINHQGILFKLCSMGVGGSVLPLLTQFLSIGHSMSLWKVVGANLLS